MKLCKVIISRESKRLIGEINSQSIFFPHHNKYLQWSKPKRICDIDSEPLQIMYMIVYLFSIYFILFFALTNKELLDHLINNIREETNLTNHFQSRNHPRENAYVKISLILMTKTITFKMMDSIFNATIYKRIWVV